MSYFIENRAYSLREYVAATKKMIQVLFDDKATTKKVEVVMGNESCDLDSVVSSVILAYHKYRWERTPAIYYLPVLNIDKADLPLKTEVVYALRKFKIDPYALPCREDLDIPAMAEFCRVKLTLVDHHILKRADAHLIQYVTEIIDHRPKDPAIWVYGRGVKVDIREVGSCATLITDRFLGNGGSPYFFENNKDCARLLHGAIVLDTANFSATADRARPLDLEMCQKLEWFLDIYHIHPEQSRQLKLDVFTELLRARTDHSQLDAYQLLRRDLKIVNKLPVPGLPMLVKDYLLKSDWEDALKKFSSENNYEVVLLMGLAIKDELIERDIAVYSLDEQNQRSKEKLTSSTEPDLKLNLTASQKNCTHYEQLNTKASRKQIIPLVKDLFKI